MKQNPKPEASAYEGFTVAMALVDMIPVILFAAAGVIAYGRIASPLFGLGVLLAAVGGGCKASWKLILAAWRRDVSLLPRLFHALLPGGFALMLLSVSFALEAWGALMASLITLPSLALVVIGCAGMVMKAVFAVKLDGRDARANWIEQLTNAAAQALFVAALLLA